ncbi:PadR family transcriptional regulator [Sinanaerobacter chloroacetimidivorans]|jgi:PadR family transcriptional regulator PadR|uniref:PadR family transcriptional regulator n=1 Tax=Sinanaerobacter chloroacetimidivorans TaxID=2818044 RepID=A0A8J7W1J0_9FIRM|nr:PadR family transcriptional regulator [Sinanaerobacter chloroacetimidivorans]MBR0599114.1 PadR family transcriptional regulator [Sinanaerobacter chloroacetimidivorans]
MGFQVGSTLLDACVLAVLSRGDTYGYILTQTMRDAMDISESTLYPVLRRLQKDGYLTTYDQPFQGRNRRYYAITAEGRAKYESYKNDWIEYKTQVDKLLCGGVDNEQV